MQLPITVSISSIFEVAIVKLRAVVKALFPITITPK